MPRTNVVGATPSPGSGAQRCAQASEREPRTDSTAGTATATAAAKTRHYQRTGGVTRRAGAAAVMTKFQESAAALASSPAPRILKFQREDWSLFRTLEGLQQRA